MELRKFIEKHGARLASKIEENLTYVYNPLKPEGVEEFERRIPGLVRKPYPVQAEIIKGLSKALYRDGRKHLFLAGEMGTGKTLSALSTVFMSEKPLRVLVVCPTHLVEKWMREARQTIPGVDVINLSVRNVISILDGLRRIRHGPSTHEIYVISKERAKLSYGWKPSANYHSWSKFPYCPRCGKVPQGKGEDLLTQADLGRKRCFCNHCGEALWQAAPLLKRFSPSEYIKKYLRSFWDMVIFDEIQDFKAGDSLQGQAMGMLLNGRTKVLCLTGTLNGGYADDLFFLLYRMEPGLLKADGFNYRKSREWLEAYGTIEYEQKIEDDDHYYGRGRKKNVIVRKRPGVSPLVVGKYLLDRSCFIRLADVIDGLPPYEERVILLKMKDVQREEYEVFENKLRDAVRQFKTKALSSMLQALLSYPDSCVLFEENVVIKDKSGEVLDTIHAPLVSEKLLPKEEELIRLVKEEIKSGNKVLCYLTFTGTRDIRPRLKKILTEVGIRVGVLDASVDPQKREAWIERHVGEMDVLLVNAELVKTGLDLYDFPTVIFFQTGYNIFTLRQAARRSWRIGQAKPVKVLFFCYEGTMQDIALSLIAKKLEVALMVEGDLPEGLAQYGVGTSSIIEEMGKALVEGGSFQSAESSWANFRKKELEAQLGLGQKETLFEDVGSKKLGIPGATKVSVDKNVVIRVSIITGKKKRQSVVEVKDGDLDSIANGNPIQFCLF
jgi:SNF2 family DNA or RNA helicase